MRIWRNLSLAVVKQIQGNDGITGGNCDHIGLRAPKYPSFQIVITNLKTKWTGR